MAHCPHCVNSLNLDYSQLGAELDVVHHSVFLTRLVAGWTSDAASRAKHQLKQSRITTHAYLSRAWDITEAPRELMNVSTADGSLVEMPRRGQHARVAVLAEDECGSTTRQKAGSVESRVNEALGTGATTLAVACPFCLTMLSDGVAARGGQMAVRDVSEILADAIL